MHNENNNESNNEIIVIRGGGDLATGLVQKFHRAGFRTVVLEIPAPTAIRRSVALCEAVYDGVANVEDVSCRRCSSPGSGSGSGSGSGFDRGELEACWREGVVPLLVDTECDFVRRMRPAAVVDAILAKRNCGTSRDMADITIALGPGFVAGVDADVVIETMRGHDLGKLIFQGSAKPDTGIPGEINGKSRQRVLRAPVSGKVTHVRQIGDVVMQDEVLFFVGESPVCAPFPGLLRGLIREGMDVPEGMKVADVDPRTDVDWRTISDKARCLGGAALEAYLYLKNKR